MIGYLAGPIGGAVVYDAAHTYVGPVALASIGVIADAEFAVQIGPIWLVEAASRRPLAAPALRPG